MLAALDFTFYIHVSHRDILHHGEYGCIVLFAPVDIKGHRMTVAMEGSAIGPVTQAHGLRDSNIGIQDGIDILGAGSLFHQFPKLQPVVIAAYHIVALVF